MAENYLNARFSGDVDVMSPGMVELNQIFIKISRIPGCSDCSMVQLDA